MACMSHRTCHRKDRSANKIYPIPTAQPHAQIKIGENKLRAIFNETQLPEAQSGQKAEELKAKLEATDNEIQRLEQHNDWLKRRLEWA